MTRDLLLAEISRSLRATHPDRAEEIIAEVEKRLLSLADLERLLGRD